MSFTPRALLPGLVIFAGIVYAPIRMLRGAARAGGFGPYWASEPLWLKVLLILGALLFTWWVLWLVGSIVFLIVQRLRSRPRG